MVCSVFWKNPMSVSSTSHSQELKSYQAILFLPPCSILYFWWIFFWYSRLQLDCFPAKKDQQSIFHWRIWIQQIQMFYFFVFFFFTFVIRGSFCKIRTIIIFKKVCKWVCNLGKVKLKAMLVSTFSSYTRGGLMPIAGAPRDLYTQLLGCNSLQSVIAITCCLRTSLCFQCWK